MIKGISYRVPQATTDTLWQMLGAIDTEIFDWYNIESQNEVWDDTHAKPFFETGHYTGKDFATLIKKEHFIVFLKLQAYCSPYEFSEIHSHVGFLNSDCQMLILIYDCEFVEIFAKNVSLVEKLYENAMHKEYLEVTQITDFNDNRTGMDIL